MRPLPVITIVKAAALVVWRKRLSLFRTLTAAGLAIALLDTAPGYFSMGRPGWAITTLYSALSAIILTLFAVTCHRIVLLDETATPRFGIHTWSKREMRFLGWTVVGYLFFLVIMIIIGLIVGAIPGLVNTSDVSLLIYAMLLPSSYMLARLSILLPATAVDERHDMKWAWDITANNGWRLTVIVALLPVLLGFIGVFISDFTEIEAPLILRFIGHFLSYSLVAVEIAALSVSFQYLKEANSTGNSRASVR